MNVVAAASGGQVPFPTIMGRRIGLWGRIDFEKKG